MLKPYLDLYITKDEISKSIKNKHKGGGVIQNGLFTQHDLLGARENG